MPLAGVKALGRPRASWMELVLVVSRAGGVGPLGLSLNDANVVLAVAPDTAAHGTLEPGDRILACDGRELKGRAFVKVVRPQPTHTLKVLRCDGGPQGHGDASAKHGPHPAARKAAGRPRVARGWFGRRQLHHAGSAFGIGAAAAPTWFGGDATKGGLHE